MPFMPYTSYSRSFIEMTWPSDMFNFLKKLLNMTFIYVFIAVFEYIVLSATVISRYDSFVESNTESVSR